MQGLGIWLVSGNNVAQFLQGQLTADIHAGMQCFCYCNSKGRVCTLGWVFEQNGHWYLLLPEESADAMFTAWAPYAIFSNITVTKAVNLGWNTADNIETSGLSWQKQSQVIYISDDNKHNGNWHEFAIQNSIPVITEQHRFMYTPHMLSAAEWSVSFTKGCYLGQEIIARTQHLGKIKRKLVTFEITAPPSTSAISDINGDKVGDIIFNYKNLYQAVVSPTEQYFIAGNPLALASL